MGTQHGLLTPTSTPLTTVCACPQVTGFPAVDRHSFVWRRGSRAKSAVCRGAASNRSGLPLTSQQLCSSSLLHTIWWLHLLCLCSLIMSMQSGSPSVPCLREDWLHKRSPAWPHSLQKRWFVLTSTRLSYFKSRHDRKPAGELLLDTITSVGTRDNVLVISTDSRVYDLSAEAANDSSATEVAEQWQQAISSARDLFGSQSQRERPPVEVPMGLVVAEDVHTEPLHKVLPVLPFQSLSLGEDPWRELPAPEPPASFLCPIGREVMADPVTCADGHSYDRCHIAMWLVEHNTSPVTGAHLPSRILIPLIPNIALRNAIEEWEDAQFAAESAWQRMKRQREHLAMQQQGERQLEQQPEQTQQESSPPQPQPQHMQLTPRGQDGSQSVQGEETLIMPSTPEPLGDAPGLHLLKGSPVLYTDGEGRQHSAQVLVVHPGGPDDPDPFFTIELDDGRERETVRSRLQLLSLPPLEPASPVATAEAEARRLAAESEEEARREAVDRSRLEARQARAEKRSQAALPQTQPIRGTFFHHQDGPAAAAGVRPQIGDGIEGCSQQ